MYTYEQKTGRYLDADGKVLAHGYSGHGAGVNNPDMQHVPMVGPIPVGRYRIGPGVTHPKLGPVAMPLTPMPGTNTFGRSGFYEHGDNAAGNHTASEGCIILPHSVRVLVNMGSDKELLVVP